MATASGSCPSAKRSIFSTTHSDSLRLFSKQSFFKTFKNSSSWYCIIVNCEYCIITETRFCLLKSEVSFAFTLVKQKRTQIALRQRMIRAINIGQVHRNIFLLRVLKCILPQHKYGLCLQFRIFCRTTNGTTFGEHAPFYYKNRDSRARY